MAKKTDKPKDDKAFFNASRDADGKTTQYKDGYTIEPKINIQSEEEFFGKKKKAAKKTKPKKK